MAGRKHNPSNLRRDVLARAVEAANVKLAEAGIAPLGSITFHSLRRTYASLQCVCGDDIRYAADQLGHEDPRFTRDPPLSGVDHGRLVTVPETDEAEVALGATKPPTDV